MPPVDSRHPAPALSDDWPLTYLPTTTPRHQEQIALSPPEYADQLSLRIEAARQALDAGPRLLSQPCDKNAIANPEAWTAEEAIREVGSTLLNQIDISFPRIEGVLRSAISEQTGTDGLASLANGDVDHVTILMRNLDAVHKTSLWHCERHLGELENSRNAISYSSAPNPGICGDAGYRDVEACLREDRKAAIGLDHLLQVRARAVRDQVMQELSRIRSFGSPPGTIRGTEDSNPSLVKALNSASQYFPTDWITESTQQYPILRIQHLTPQEADDAVGTYWPAGGEEDASLIEVPRIGVAARLHQDPHQQTLFLATVLHEVSHHFVDINDTIGCLEEVFFQRRTGIGAGLIDPSMGGHIEPCPNAGEHDCPSLEIIASGVESLFMGSYGSLLGLDAQWPADRDHAAFVLGVLALA